MFSQSDFLEGKVLLLDKPLSWTSFQVVNKVRWQIRKKYNLKSIKVGHAGTLDPLATGLLLLCTGKYTKKISHYQNKEKEYTGVIRLGATTPSYDLETDIDKQFDMNEVTQEMIHKATYDFLGTIDQIPPIFSAIKKDGKRLYQYARNSEKVTLKARKVTVSSFEISKIEFPDIYFRVVCSKGTYIRSLAHDFGKKLGGGAHLSALRRTKIGDYKVDDAISIECFKDLLSL